jgi:hypothetical protein
MVPGPLAPDDTHSVNCRVLPIPLYTTSQFSKPVSLRGTTPAVQYGMLVVLHAAPQWRSWCQPSNIFNQFLFQTGPCDHEGVAMQCNTTSRMKPFGGLTRSS